MRSRFAAALLLVFGLGQGLSVEAVRSDQGKKPFTIEDYFLTRSVRVDDLTEDGRFLAAPVMTPGDRLPQDNARYGDPTYVGPPRAELVVIETASGRALPGFAGKRQGSSP